MHAHIAAMVAMLLAAVASVAAAAATPLKVSLLVDKKTPALSATHPAQLSRVPAIQHNSTLSVSLDAESAASQALLIVTHERGEPSFTYPFMRSIDLTLSKGFVDGKYALEVALLNARDPVLYHFGDVDFARADDNNVIADSKKEREEALSPKQEILHQFRPEQKSPNPLLPLTGVIAALAPWALLVPLWAVIMKPMRASSIAPSIPFIACLSGFPVLYYLYWTRINLVELLPLWGSLAVITIVAGVVALRDQATWRLTHLQSGSTGSSSSGSKKKKTKTL
ncbi:hypothetical protein RI367_002506 [Sorochytrium milnesiophthora]